MGERASRRVTIAIPLVLAMLTMIGPFTIDTPFPAFAEMAREFRVGSEEMQLVVTAYLVAFAAMSIFHGPISDAVGRRPVMVGSVVVYVAGSLACAFAPSLAWLVAFRVLQGLSAGGATIVSRTVIRDLFDGDDAQRLMSRVALIFGVAPAVAPVVGGLLLQVGPWTWVFGFQAVLGLVLIAAVLVVLPETHPAEARVPLRVGAVLGGLVTVGRVPAFHRLAAAGTLGFGAQFLYIGGAAIFVVDLLGQGELDFWKLFAPMIGSMMVGSWVSGRTAGRVTRRRLVSVGYSVTTLGAVAGVALASSPLATHLPWAVVGPSLIALGNGLAWPTVQLMQLDLFPARRGAAMSFATFATLLFNAAAAFLLTPLVDGSTLGMALAALAMVVVGQASWVWHCAVEDRGRQTADGRPVLEPSDLA